MYYMLECVDLTESKYCLKWVNMLGSRTGTEDCVSRFTNSLRNSFCRLFATTGAVLQGSSVDLNKSLVESFLYLRFLLICQMRKFWSNIHFGCFSFLEIRRDIVSEQYWEHPVPIVPENLFHDFFFQFWTDPSGYYLLTVSPN